MAITFAELPGYLSAIRARVEASAVPCADAIGETYQRHLQDVTLTESGGHGMMSPGAASYPPAAPAGRPPMEMTGRLRESVAKTPAVPIGPAIAETSVAPHVIYAATQEFGGVHTGHMWLWVNRLLTSHEVHLRGWVKREVTIRPHPYMSTAVEESIANGELERAGAAAFMAVVWGE